MEIQVAVAKVSKYAVSESGDTLEMIERPHGGLSLVLADGQSSGRGAKAVSNLVVRKAIQLLADGVRDGAAARAAHDYLRTQREGKVSATLNIISVDLVSRTLVLSRNSHAPLLVAQGMGAEASLRVLDEPSEAIGIYARTKPLISELPVAANLTVVVFTDGLIHAGSRYAKKLDIEGIVLSHHQARPIASAQILADTLLEQAVTLDQGRPSDDVSVVVLCITPVSPKDGARRMNVSFPIPPVLKG